MLVAFVLIAFVVGAGTVLIWPSTDDGYRKRTAKRELNDSLVNRRLNGGRR